MTSALVIFSGGQDSTTCLFLAKQRHNIVRAINFDYGQKHSLEILAAEKIASAANILSYEIIRLQKVLKGTSPLVNSYSEVKKYRKIEDMPLGIEDTFVPSRNSLFLTIAMNRAAVLNCSHIYLGVSQVDYGGYPDCRELYLQKISDALNLGIFGEDKEKWIKVETPFLHLSKKETVLLAASLHGCLEALAYSHTCYNGEYPPCGQCHSCLLRMKGFEEAGILDPILKRGEKV